MSDPFDGIDLLPYDRDANDDAAGPVLLGARDFPYVGVGLSAEAFAIYVQSYDFGPIPPDYVCLHHTAIPDASWAPASADPRTKWDRDEAHLTSASQIYEKRRSQLDHLRDYYRDTLGWSAGPHLFIDERFIWLMTPLADIGIHAKWGNAFRASGALHYSIGIEMIGCYEGVVWPAPVQRLVGAAVVALQRRLGTFRLDYLYPNAADKPGMTVVNGAQCCAHPERLRWGGIVSHRDFNKIACPGAAITEAFYLDVLRRAASETPTPSSARRYVVKPHTSAVVRAAPRKNAPQLRTLHGGDTWAGVEVMGGQASAPGYGTSQVWVQNADGACVARILLDEVTP